MGFSSFRLTALQALLKKEKIDAFLISDPSDLFYFTGLSLSLGALWVSEEKATLFVDGRYFESAIEHLSSYKEIKVALLDMEGQKECVKGAKSVAVEGQTILHRDFLLLSKGLNKELISIEGMVNRLRRIKSKEEIDVMQHAATLGYQAYLYAKRLLKPGISEKEVAAKLKIHCLKEGIEGLSFEPIIAFGKNSAHPHHRPSETILAPNDIALIDLGVVFEKYCSDMTRVVFIGAIDPQLKKLYQVVKKAQEAALALCRPGTLLEELDGAAREEMAKEGLEEYFVHSLGHGVGIDIHESPRIKKGGIEGKLALEEGMVITIEPGLYLPGKGGIRYEDTIAITEKGYINFYARI